MGHKTMLFLVAVISTSYLLWYKYPYRCRGTASGESSGSAPDQADSIPMVGDEEENGDDYGMLQGEYRFFSLT